MSDKDETKKKNWFVRHKVMTVILAIVTLAIVVSASSGGSKTNTTASKTTTPATADTNAKIGEAARDGKFEFVVKSLQCGQPTVGSDYSTKTAQGQYCLLTVNVKNIGDEKQSLFSSNQTLLDASSKKYSADDMATLYAAPQGSSSWYSDINPGNSVEGVIVFDVPKDVTPTVAVLHDSMASNGIKVTLQ